MLMCPKLPGNRMRGSALNIPVPIAEDFRFYIPASDKRIIRRNATFFVDAYYRSRMVIQSLRPGPITPVAQGDEQAPIRLEDQSRSEMAASTTLGHRAEYDFRCDQRIALEPASGDFRSHSAAPLCRIREVDQTVVLEPGMQCHIQ